MTSRSRVAPAVLVPVLVLVLAAAGLTACSGDSGGGEPAGSAGSGTSAPAASPSASPYLPVPTGVQLTPEGKHLELGDPATVAWEPRQGLVGVLDLTVTRIEQTTVADTMSGWQLTAQQKASTPYFVHVDARNVGQTDVGGRAVPLYGLTTDDLLLEATPFVTSFKPCPSTGFPKPFGPGATASLCLVYLAPRHGELKGVSFRPEETFDPIYWTGPAATYSPSPTTKPKKPDRTKTAPAP